MLVALSTLVSLATVVLAGGRLGRLADVRLRAPWLVAAALGAQVVVISLVPGSFPGVHAPVHLTTYALLGAFVWINRSVPGLVIVGLGAAANAIAIGVNDGVMPASASALATAGMPPEKAGEFANSAVVDEPRLGWLGDVFAVPEGWPLNNVFSVGDALIVVGFAVGVHVLGASRLGALWRCARRRRRS